LRVYLLTVHFYQVAKAFIGYEEPSLFGLKIAGKTHEVEICPSASHFQGVNILGSDFFGRYSAEMRNLNDGRYRFAFIVGADLDGIHTADSTYHWEDTTAGHKIIIPGIF